MSVVYDINTNGGGLKFIPGDSNKIIIPHSPLLDITESGSYTIGVSFYLSSISSGTNQYIFSKTTGLFVSGYNLQINKTSFGTTRLLFGCHDGIIEGDVIGNIILTDGYHYAVILKSGNNSNISNWKMNIDNNFVYTFYQNSTSDFGSITNTSPLLLGCNGVSSQFFNGFLFDLKMFDIGFNDSQIKELSSSKGNSIPSGTYDNMVFDYNFNDKSGTDLQDKSKNNLTGTLSGFLNTNLNNSNQWVNEYGIPVAA